MLCRAKGAGCDVIALTKDMCSTTLSWIYHSWGAGLSPWIHEAAITTYAVLRCCCVSVPTSTKQSFASLVLVRTVRSPLQEVELLNLMLVKQKVLRVTESAKQELIEQFSVNPL